MTANEVDFVLDAIENNYGTPLSDIPLERVDRDNSDLLEDSQLHDVSPELEEMNYVGASSESVTRSYVGTDPNFEIEAVVNVRLVGAHVSEAGAIDPQAGTDDAAAYASWPTTTWDDLKWSTKRAILDKVKFPDAGRSNVGYKDLTIANETDNSSNYGDAYLATFDVLFMGFEDRR